MADITSDYQNKVFWSIKRCMVIANLKKINSLTPGVNKKVIHTKTDLQLLAEGLSMCGLVDTKHLRVGVSQTDSNKNVLPKLTRFSLHKKACECRIKVKYILLQKRDKKKN